MKDARYIIFRDGEVLPEYQQFWSKSSAYPWESYMYSIHARRWWKCDLDGWSHAPVTSVPKDRRMQLLLLLS